MSDHEKLFGLLKGKYVWGVENGFGTHLSMEFGEARLNIREPQVQNAETKSRAAERLQRRVVRPIGFYRLLLLDDAWVLGDNDAEVSAQSNGLDIANAISRLSGQIVETISFHNDGPLTLNFDLGSRLIVNRTVEPTEEGFIFTAGDIVFSPTGTKFALNWEI
ncbi:MAG: hypothetical protein EON58_03470 [Alphaproteobacteria bacterium]|nr:MAG: hypothetical protein EON58_03470 [Alphaproteobacteria bacterium]